MKVKTETKITEKNQYDDHVAPGATNASDFKTNPDLDKPYGKYLDTTYKVVSRDDGSAFIFSTNTKNGTVSQEYFRDAKEARSEAAKLRAWAKQRAIKEMSKHDPEGAKKLTDKAKADQDKRIQAKKDNAGTKVSVVLMNENIKDKQIKAAKEERDRLNGKKKSDKTDGDIRWITMNGAHIPIKVK